MSGQADDLSAFSRALAGVPPHPGLLDRDALLFAAGRAAARRGRFWPVTAGVLAALSAALAGVLLFRPPTVVEVERIVHVPAPAPAVPDHQPVAAPDDQADPSQSSPSPDLAEGLRQRHRILGDGVSTQPQRPWASSSPGSSEDVPSLSSLRVNAHPDGEQFR
jgi:hypothetical protein